MAFSEWKAKYSLVLYLPLDGGRHSYVTEHTGLEDKEGNLS